MCLLLPNNQGPFLGTTKDKTKNPFTWRPTQSGLKWIIRTKWLNVAQGGLKWLKVVYLLFCPLKPLQVGKIKWGLFGEGAFALLDLYSNPASKLQAECQILARLPLPHTPPLSLRRGISGHGGFPAELSRVEKLTRSSLRRFLNRALLLIKMGALQAVFSS